MPIPASQQKHTKARQYTTPVAASTAQIVSGMTRRLVLPDGSVSVQHLTLAIKNTERDDWLIDCVQVSAAGSGNRAVLRKGIAGLVLCAFGAAALALTINDFRQFSRGALSLILFGTSFLVLQALDGPPSGCRLEPNL